MLSRSCPCSRISSTKSNPTSPHNHDNCSWTQEGRENNILCPTCVQNSIYTLLERQRRAIEELNQRKEWCARRLTELEDEEERFHLNNIEHNFKNDKATKSTQQQQIKRTTNLPQLKSESDTLRSCAQTLRHLRNHAELSMASLQIQNDARENDVMEHASRIHSAQRTMTGVYENCVMRDMERNLRRGAGRIARRRFRLALGAFGIIRIDVGQENAAIFSSEEAVSSRKIPTGIGKISGLVLPHAGPALYGPLDPHALSSALRLVASLTSAVARCLGIVLPHPILLHAPPRAPLPDYQNNDIIFTLPQQQQERREASTCSSSSSHSSSFGHSFISAKRALARATGTSTTPSPMDTFSIGKRIRHACTAILLENPPKPDDPTLIPQYYDLRPSYEEEDDENNFAVGLQLLQNDVVALCIRAGVDVERLWPAEALLLNLFELRVFCGGEVQKKMVDDEEEKG